MANIQHTEEYTSFKRIQGNRTINKAQVKKLRDSFDENPEIASAVPIIVNDKMEIIDGQHRFLAWKQLNLPIYYYQVKGMGLSEVQKINSVTKNWSPADYAKSFAELGNKNYKVYLEFKEKYHFTHHVLLMVLGSSEGGMSGSTTHTFRRGKFVVNDVIRSHTLAQQLIEIQKYYPRGDSRVFSLAFKKCANSPIYDHQRMIEKVSAHGAKFFKDSPYAEDYMRQLEKIYNFHMGVENRMMLFTK